MKSNIILAMALVLATGCTKASGRPKPKPTVTSETKIIRNNGYSCGELKTVKHDGHLFVVFFGGYKGGLTHHPDCLKCKNTK